jgi:hypothetical protein
MGFSPLSLFANSIITPVPDFDYANGFEVVVWGVCVSFLVISGGLAVISKKWRVWLLVIAVASFIGCFVFGTRPGVRHWKENMERLRQEKERQDEKELPDQRIILNSDTTPNSEK